MNEHELVLSAYELSVLLPLETAQIKNVILPEIIGSSVAFQTKNSTAIRHTVVHTYM